MMKKYVLPKINLAIYKLADVVLSSIPTQKKKTADYKKSFPHVLTNENSSDEEKALDDVMFMDLMDD